MYEDIKELGRPARLDSDKLYIGIETKTQILGDWKYRLSIHTFKGRPSNIYDYDAIIEYTESKWNEFVNRIKKECEVNNEELFEKIYPELVGSYAYSVPKWTHIPKPKDDVEINTEQARKRVKELFTGNTLDSWIEAARTASLIPEKKGVNPGNPSNPGSDKCPNLKLIDECYDAHSGQSYCRIVTYDGGTDEYLGRIDYSIFEKEIYVDMIEVEEKHRRCGIASKMLEKLEKEYSNQIHYGLSTEEGIKFLQAYKSRHTTDNLGSTMLTTGPRPTCTDCAKKHLSQAQILISESKRGYPDHYWLALGHMAEAEEELVGEYPDHANTIREERKRVESSKGEYIPDYLKLIKTIDSECEGCKLNSNPSHNPNSTMLGANGSGNPGKVLNSPEYAKFIEKNNIKEKGECGTCDNILTTLKNKYGKDNVRTNMVTRIMSVGAGVGIGGGLGWVITRIGKEIDIRWKDAAGVARINKPVEVQVRTWFDIAKALGATIGLIVFPKYIPEDSIRYFAAIGIGAEGLSRTADHAEAVIDKMVGVTYVPYRAQTFTPPSPYPSVMAQGQPGQVIIQASPEMMSVS